MTERTLEVDDAEDFFELTASVFDTFDPSKARRLRRCRDAEESGTYRCNCRHCPRCSQLLAERNSRKVLRVIEKMKARRPILIIVNCRTRKTRDLVPAIEKLRTQFAAIRRLARFSRSVRSGVFCLEVLPGEHGFGWVPHIHCILDADGIDVNPLNRIWRKKIGTSFSGKIELAKDPLLNRKHPDGLATYITKPKTWLLSSRLFDADDARFLFPALKGRRLIDGWGPAFSKRRRSSQVTIESS